MLNNNEEEERVKRVGEELAKFSTKKDYEDLGNLSQALEHAEETQKRLETVPKQIERFFTRVVVPRTQQGIHVLRTTMMSAIENSGVLNKELCGSVAVALGEIISNAAIYGIGEDIKAFVEVGDGYVAVGVANKVDRSLPICYPQGRRYPALEHKEGYTRGRGLKIALIMMDEVRIYCDAHYVSVWMIKHADSSSDDGRVTDQVNTEKELIAREVDSIFTSEVSPYQFEPIIQELAAEILGSQTVLAKIKRWLRYRNFNIRRRRQW